MSELAEIHWTALHERYASLDREDAKQLSGHIAAILSACAAGEWCYDVENAPYKPDILVISSIGVVSLAARNQDGAFVTVPGRWSLPDVVAFAAINPPEIAP